MRQPTTNNCVFRSGSYYVYKRDIKWKQTWCIKKDCRFQIHGLRKFFLECKTIALWERKGSVLPNCCFYYFFSNFILVSILSKCHLFLVSYEKFEYRYVTMICLVGNTVTAEKKTSFFRDLFRVLLKHELSRTHTNLHELSRTHY